ncbi:MAG: ribbon-helix-helix domain-containing protein [Rubrivivax sp.]
MDTLTVKIPAPMQAALEQASRRERLPKSELVRRALQSYLARPAAAGAAAQPSALDLAGDLVGCFSGGPKDLASNPKHMEGFGR